MYKWLYIDPYVEMTFNHSQNNCLLFNTLDSKKYIFEGKEYEIVKRLFKNGYSIQISEIELQEYKSLINKFEDYFIGGVYLSKDKPLILYPILNIQRNLRKFKDISYREQGTDILENLLEFSIHFKNNSNRLKVDRIIKLIEDSENSSLKKINIFIELYSIHRNQVDELVSFLKTSKVKTYIYINIKEYNSFISDFTDIASLEIFSVVVVVDYQDFDEKILAEENIKLKFKISNEDEYKHYSSKITEGRDHDFEVDFDKADSTFLRENVFLNEEDIQEIKVTKQNYDANKTLNRNLFGKLVIKDNAIYSCENSTKAIANLDNEINLKQIIFDALCKSNYWFLTRNKVNPCKSCLYKNVCPPISEYELQLKRYNLCNVLAM